MLNSVEIEELSLLHEAMYNYSKTQDSPMILQSLQLFVVCAWKLILYQIVVIFSTKTVFFDDIVHLIDEENIGTYVDFDCGITFYPEAPTKIKQINRDQKNISRSCEKRKCITSNDQHHCCIDKEHTSDTFLNPFKICETDPAALKSLNHNNDGDSMSNHYPRTTSSQPGTDLDPVSSTLGTMDSKRKGCRANFAIFQKNYLLDGRLKRLLLRLKNRVISVRPEQWMELKRLWWTAVVFQWNCLFQLFIFQCLLLWSFFQKNFFCFSLMNFLSKIKVQQQLLCKVTLP